VLTSSASLWFREMDHSIRVWNELEGLECSRFGMNSLSSPRIQCKQGEALKKIEDYLIID
jgi:hypothetical protein